MKILQRFQPAHLKQLSQQLRVVENSSKGSFFVVVVAVVQTCSKMSVKLHERLQTPKHCSSDTHRLETVTRSGGQVEFVHPRRGTASTGEADARSSNRPAATFTTARKQLTSRALPWSHNSPWCPMSSFSTRFHPLQEASYNGDGIRHTAATGREQNTESSQSRSQKFQTGSLISIRGG